MSSTEKMDKTISQDNMKSDQVANCDQCTNDESQKFKLKLSKVEDHTENSKVEKQEEMPPLPLAVNLLDTSGLIRPKIDIKFQEKSKKVIQVFDQIKNINKQDPIIFKNNNDMSDKEKEAELDEHIKTVFSQVGIIPKWMLTRTNRCKHKHTSCYENVAYGFTKTFIYSLAIKFILNNIGLITNFRKLLRNLVSFSSLKDNFRFAFFLALTNGLYKLVLCLMRRYFQSDKLCALVAGFIAGLSCRIDAKGRRTLLTVLLMSRGSDVLFNMAESNGVVKRIPYGEVLLWFVCNVCQQYAMACESDTLNPGQYKFQRKWSLVSKMPTLDSTSSAMNERIRDQIKASARPGWIVNFGK